MRLISFFSVGILFGIILTKSEAISWFRIHEMFRFESFHMYGLLATAVAFSATVLFLMKKTRFKTLENQDVTYNPMKLSVKRHLIAGTIFGLGWALVGSCPGPMFILLGHGYWIMLVIMAAATLGTLTYGIFLAKLPH